MPAVKCELKGYLTVEASLVMPIVLTVIMFLLYTGFYQYDRCLMELDTASVLVKVSNTGYSKSRVGELVNFFLKQTNREKYYAWEYTDNNYRLSQSRVSVMQRGQLSLPGRRREAQVELSINRTDPVLFIRNKRHLENLLE